MVAAAFTLTNCTQEIENPNQAPDAYGYPFEVVANTPDTKTVNEGMSTKWEKDDAISLFHVESYEDTYSSNNKFTIAEEDLATGKFTGTLTEELADENDWYALYPYNENVKTPGAKTSGYMYIGYSNGLDQTGYDNMASLKGSVCPLYGVVSEVAAGDTPEITMQHLSSVVEFEVTNMTDDPLVITTASLTATEDVVGSYFIDITKYPVEYTPSNTNYVKKTAVVNVKEGTELAKDQSAKLYVAIKPFTAPKDQTLKVSVNGYEKEIALTQEVTFTAGKIKTIKFAYDKEKVELPALTLPWYEDFSDEDLSAYNVVNGGSDTKVYPEDVLAGGEAGELLIGKNNGSFSVTVATGGYVGDLALTFKSNHADYISVTCDGAELTKVTDSEYLLTIAQGVQNFTLTLTNTAGSNARVDDLEIAKPRAEQTLTFAKTLYDFVVGSADVASFTGQTVSGAKTAVTYSSNNEEVATVDAATGAVTMTGATGTAVITATAVQTPEYKAAVAAYTVKVSDPGATVTTKTVTYTFGTDTEVGFSSWNSSYTSRTADYEDATVKFTSANKQSGTITNMPVTKGQPVEIIMKDNRTLKSFKLTLEPWIYKGAPKEQTVTLHTSVDGGSTYTETTTKSSDFALEGTLPAGTNAIKFTFSSTSNQVGIQSCELTFDVAE